MISQYFSKNVTEAAEYYQRTVQIRNNNDIVEYQLSKLSQEHPEMKLGDPCMSMKSANWKGYIPANFEFAKMIEESTKNKYDTSDILPIFIEYSLKIMNISLHHI